MDSTKRGVLSVLIGAIIFLLLYVAAVFVPTRILTGIVFAIVGAAFLTCLWEMVKDPSSAKQ